jgi:hypothetical protein
MSQSTPINMIRRDDPSMVMSNNDNNNIHQNSDSQLVEDILKEMGDSPGLDQQSNINSQAYQYAMDNSQAPVYKSNDKNSYYDDRHYAEKMMHQQQESNSGLFGQMGINLNGDSIKDKILKNIKYPMLVFVLCFLLSLPEFNRFIFSFFPRLLLESGQVSIGGVLLKAFLGMLIFAIASLFI